MSKHERFPELTDDEPGDLGRNASSPALRTPGKGGFARLFGIGTLLLLLGLLALGTYQHFALHAQVIATAKEHSDFVPRVRVAPVRASSPTWPVTLPGTTSAFAAANIYARATGYISRREVDIGDPVKKGQLLAEITAPELDHQIAQAEATLAQLKAALAAGAGQPRPRQRQLGARQAAGREGLGHPAAGRHRPVDPRRPGGGGGGRAGQHQAAGGAAAGPAPAEGLSERSGAVRRRRDPTQRRYRNAWSRPMRPAAPSCLR